MPSAEIDLSMRDVMRRAEVTLTLNVYRDWRVRLGLWIATVGLRLTGLSVKIEDEA